MYTIISKAFIFLYLFNWCAGHCGMRRCDLLTSEYSRLAALRLSQFDRLNLSPPKLFADYNPSIYFELVFDSLTHTDAQLIGGSNKESDASTLLSRRKHDRY